jgi:hypothetical protein
MLEFSDFNNYQGTHDRTLTKLFYESDHYQELVLPIKKGKSAGRLNRYPAVLPYG